MYINVMIFLIYRLELAFITMNLKGATTSLWIGMNNFHVRNSFYWTDNSPVNIYNWNEGEPAMISRYQTCVDISPFPRNAGKWRSRSCYLRLGYICKTGDYIVKIYSYGRLQVTKDNNI